jgi:beta-glucosidase
MRTLKKQFSILMLSSFFIGTSQNETLEYLNPNISVENRVKDLMDRMTLEEKVYQMNQFVGLDHMRKAEKDLTEEELHSNDAQGFYKGLFSDDVAEMARRGEIGSFLHVLTAEESNLLQELAAESRLKIPLLIGIDAIHGNALVSGTTVYPSPITLACTWEDSYLETIGMQTAKEMRATGSQWTFTPNIDVL